MKSFRAGNFGGFLEAAPKLVAACFAIACAGALWRVIATLGLRVPLDPNEGWNAYLALAALSGHALYPPASSLFVNNYPPLSFYLVGAIGRFLHDDILAGRLVSLASFLAIAAGIYSRIHSLRGERLAGGLAALFFMASLLIGSDYVGMDDPQLLAHAIQMAAFLVLLRYPQRVLAASFLFALSLFVKHNLIAMPLALGIWLLLYARQRAIAFAAGGLGFGLLGLVLFRIAFGTDMVGHLASARSYSLSMLVDNAQDWLAWSTVPLAIVAALAAFLRNDRFAVFCVLYAGIAFAIGIAFAGGAGVDVNVFFDADIALAMGVGVACSGFGRQWHRAAIAGALLFPLGVLFYTVSDEDWRDPDFWSHPMAEEAAMARNDIAFLRQHRGRALCESLAFCYWAGKQREVDVFNIGQAFAAETLKDDLLAQRIRSRAYAALEFDTLEPFALGSDLRSVVLGAYRIDHENDEGVFLVPR